MAASPAAEHCFCIGICDVDANVVKRRLDNYSIMRKNIPATYADYRELLANKDIDAVVISTPDHWHAITVIQSAEAGKDIYCEKPLSQTIAEARAMVNAEDTAV